YLPVAGPSKRREDVVLAFTFTITDGPVVPFDPDGRRAPLPDDASLSMGQVALAAPAGASEPLRAIYAGLGALDGFSTTATPAGRARRTTGPRPGRSTPRASAPRSPRWRARAPRPRWWSTTWSPSPASAPTSRRWPSARSPRPRSSPT